MAKFVDLKEAAAILGVTIEELTEMRSKGDIFGYRDGSSWKFKVEEVERVQTERSASGSGLGSGSAILGNDEDFDELVGSKSALSGLSGINLGSGTGLPGSAPSNEVTEESSLVSEEMLGGSAVKRGSTIIGKDGKPAGEDSDLKLASSIGKADPKSSEELSLSSGESGLSIAGGSDLKLSGGSDALSDEMLLKPNTGSGTGDLTPATAASESNLDLKMDGIDMGSAATPDSDDELLLAPDDSIDLDAEIGKKGPGSTGVGSGISVAGGESGININNPSDSGLSLEEEPLELSGGSNIDDLSLPEDEQIVALEDSGELEAATQLKADEDFSLSPSQEVSAGDESDSGSQVIALEDSASFDQSSATMLNQGVPAGLVADDSQAQPFDSTGFSPEMMAGIGTGAAAATAAGYSPVGYVPSEPAEAPYSIWNVLFLMMAASVLGITGALMWDLMGYIGGYPGSEPGTTVVMDALVNAAGFSK